MILLRKEDVVLGKPLPWPIYDVEQNLVMREGFVLANKAQLEMVAERGMYRPTEDRPPPPRSVTVAEVEEATKKHEKKRFDFDDLRLPIGTRLLLSM